MKCVICQTEFKPRGRQLSCSPECAKQRKYEKLREWKGAHPELIQRYRQKAQTEYTITILRTVMEIPDDPR